MSRSRERKIQIRLSAQEHETLREAADASGLPLVTWLRHLAMRRAARLRAEQGDAQ